MSASEPQTSFTAPDIAELAPLFPGYELETLIAVGGMGAVYRAIQKSLDRTVAIKILPKEFSADASFCAGFEAEAKAMARLNHPNLIGVYDFGEVMGMLYIIMEYVPGKSLFHSAHGIAIDPEEAIRIVVGICNGLAHAHEHGIIHRDIKPSNILLDLNAEPKIGDFGLARPIERKIQEGEEIFGTPHYTAPEVVQAPHSVDNRADIFSVGVLIHELLTGRLPADDPRPASAISHCNPRFDAIIRKASHPLPTARYASASKLASELQNITTSSGPKIIQPQARAGPSMGKPRPYTKPIASSRKSSAGSLFYTIIAFALVGGAIYYTSREPAAPPIINPPANPIPEPTPPDNSLNIHTIPESRPQPETQPETPETRPVPQPETPETEPETPETPPETQPESTFDTDEFLKRARTIMVDRAKPTIAASHKEIDRNLTAYGLDIIYLIRQFSQKSDRDIAEAQLKEFMSDCRDDGSRIPLEPDFEIEGKFLDLHNVYLQKQEDIDAKLIQQITELSRTYILGIELQISRLDATLDAKPIETLKQEIEDTRKDPDSFVAMILEDD